MHRTLGELIAYRSHLAQWRGSFNEYNESTGRAYVVERIAVSSLFAHSSDSLIGKIPAGREWSGYVYRNSSDPYGRYIDTDLWKVEEVRTELPKPAATKSAYYVWSASSQEWVRRSYDHLCQSCGRYHTPTVIPCEFCNKCHGRASHCAASPVKTSPRGDISR